MIVVLLRCFVMYFVVILAVRLMGKRQIGELQPAELVITILISELASMPMQDLHLPILSAIFPIFLLVLLEVVISVIALKSISVRTFLYGHPLILIYKGNFRQKEMEKARVTVDDILEIMRNNGISDISEVDYAVLETNGQLSVIEKAHKKPLSADDLKITVEKSTGLPHLLVIDGRLIKDNLNECNLSIQWLQKQLKKNKFSSVKDVFLMTVNDEKEVFLVRKE